MNNDYDCGHDLDYEYDLIEIYVIFMIIFLSACETKIKFYLFE